VHRVVVVAQAERDGIRRAAQTRHFGGGECAVGSGRRRACRIRRRARLEGHLHIRLFRIARNTPAVARLNSSARVLSCLVPLIFSDQSSVIVEQRRDRVWHRIFCHGRA